VPTRSASGNGKDVDSGVQLSTKTTSKGIILFQNNFQLIQFKGRQSGYYLIKPRTALDHHLLSGNTYNGFHRQSGLMAIVAMLRAQRGVTGVCPHRDAKTTVRIRI
jgi:hypothetical protein